MEYSVVIKDSDSVRFVKLTHSQICELVIGLPRKSYAFWRGEESYTNKDGVKIKIISK